MAEAHPSAAAAARAARGARQCGADLQIIRRVGRWSSLETLMAYMGDGEEDLKIANLLNNLQKIVVLKSVHVADATATEFRVDNSQAS
mmetsp:Transcript_211/g.397  ORF Transcript_211/g.397 Transcript_211/m.397 type:complete len:88 (-) Transcript_211:84-347(-)